jgi:hypothetical protein
VSLICRAVCYSFLPEMAAEIYTGKIIISLCLFLFWAFMLLFLTRNDSRNLDW